MVLTAMFTAIICVMAQITIPTQPIPFSLSLFSIFLTGALLKPKSAFLSTLTYILLGAFGIPVFAGFRSGFQALLGMTGGYIMAYPLMALVVSIVIKKTRRYQVFWLVTGMLLSLILCYLLGTIWFTFISGSGFTYALSVCVIPFIPFDIVKIVLATITSIVIKKTLRDIL